ncbi:MAG: thioredoxin [Patescibacteria group bacterium]|jgi:thioredoxin 1
MSEIILTDQNFEEEILKSKQPALVDFFADWCGPCQMMAPIIEELAKDIGDKAKVAKLEVDANQETAQKYNVMSIPTLIFFKGGQEVERLMGVQSKETLKEKLESL